MPTTPEGRKRGRCLTARELDGAASLRRHRPQHLGVMLFRRLVQFVAHGLRTVGSADGEHDLDIRTQEAGTLQPVGCFGECSFDRRRCGLGVPLREPEEREARLRLESAPTCLAIGLLGLRKLASKAMDVCTEVRRLRCGGTIHRLLEAPVGEPRLLERLEPRALQSHELRAVHEAASGERTQIRLPVAPARQCRGPLLGATQLVDVLARKDHAAVHDAAGDRRDLARSDGDHCFVEQAESFPQPAAPDENLALHMRGERNEVGVGESLAYLHCRRSSRSRTLEVAGSPTLERNRQQKVALLDALAPFTLDQPLRPPQPPGGRADLSPKCEVHA